MGKKKDVTIYCLDGSSYVTQLEKKKFSITKNDLILIGMASISIIFLAIFAYAPLYGLILAFREDRYINIIHNITYGKPVQFEHFKSFLTDPEFGNIMKNTLGLNILQLLINFPAPIVFAILLSELLSDKFKKFVQSVTFFPHFISWVIFGGIFLNLLDYNTGIINTFFVNIGLVKEPVDILGDEKYFWGIIIITSILKGLGWGSVIYVAAISGIPKDIYEAAAIDGANRWHKIRFITVPYIAPTITLFFILSISGLLNNGIDHLWVFQNTNNIGRSEVLDTFIYKYGIPQWQYGYATAVGLFKSVVSFILLILGNTICKKVTGKGIY